jgi:hypothetical protein
MPELIWWIIFIYIAIRLLWWLWRPAPRTLLRRGPRRPVDAHDAAVAIAAVLGVRDGLSADRQASTPDRRNSPDSGTPTMPAP